MGWRDDSCKKDEKDKGEGIDSHKPDIWGIKFHLVKVKTISIFPAIPFNFQPILRAVLERGSLARVEGDLLKLMPRFLTLGELLSELYRRKELLSGMFGQRYLSVSEEKILSLLKDDSDKLEEID